MLQRALEVRSRRRRCGTLEVGLAMLLRLMEGSYRPMIAQFQPYSLKRHRVRHKHSPFAASVERQWISR